MTVWRPITTDGVGYAGLLSDAIAKTEAANPDLLWSVDEGVQFVVSDYSGQHRQATHEAHAFLVTTEQSLADWLPSWTAFREEWLPDGRRLSFKQLREPIRRSDYPHFLKLAGRLKANLITIMVDNRVAPLSGDPRELAAIWDDCFTPGATAASIEKAYRLALFVCLIQAGLRREDQPSRWISDQDEVLDSFDKRERFAGIARYLTFGLTKEFIKQTVFKSKRGQELAVSEGRMSGSIAYGYCKVHKLDAKGEPINGLREIDLDRAAVVLRIHREFDAGRTTFQICAGLNADNIAGPKGKDWRPGALLGNRHGGLGILRNPIYIGEYQFRKTSRRRRKGRMKMRFTAHSERMITQQPELVIVDKDLWDRNQARLAENVDRPFHTKRKVEYVFMGKVHCGVCDSTCIVSDGKYVCTGRQQKGICTNSRRAPREAVETSIFDRIKVHVLNTAVMGPALAAFREEVERARADHAAQIENQTARLKEVDLRIANLMIQLGGAGEASFASQLMLEELERLGAEKRRLEQQARRAQPLPPPMGDAKAIMASISETLDGLHQALQADDAEAARAKELLRGLITKVVLKPTPGSVADGRGAGDMTVSVEGPMAALIDLAELNVDRVAKHGHRPMFGLDNATSVWAFSYVLEWRDPRLATVRDDLPIIARLLDEADVPISMDKMAKALGDAGSPTGPDADRSPDQRARNAVAHLQSQGFTRCVNMRGPATGYVWNDRGFSDTEWKARIAEPPMTQTIPVMRISPPEAVVVVVGPPRLDDDPAT